MTVLDAEPSRRAWHDPQEVVSRALVAGRGHGRQGADRIGDGTRRAARAILRALKDAGYSVVRDQGR